MPDSKEIKIEGNVGSIRATGNVDVKSYVKGNINAGGSVNCGDVGGSIDTGGSVNCSNVSGNVDAGGSITCGNVNGNANAGGSILKNR